MAKPTLSREALRGLLDYDPETGILTWKARPRDMFPSVGHCKMWNTKFAGKEALCSVRPDGYRVGTVFNDKVYAHRVIWAWVHGTWPRNIDHLNHDRADNRLANLRDVSRRENLQNTRRRSDRPPGISKTPNNRWMAWIRDRAKGQFSAKVFDTLEEAAAYRKQLEIAAGYHPNHGKET